MKRIMWAAMMTLALSPIPAVAQDASATVKEVRAATAAMDQALANTVAEKIRGYVRYTIFDDVTIGVDGGMVTLSGRVTQPYKVKDIGRIASRIEGVREVKNDLEVLPVSIHDDRLRTAIARQIYRDPVFDLRHSSEPADSHHRRAGKRDADWRGEFSAGTAEGGDDRAVDVWSVQRREQAEDRFVTDRRRVPRDRPYLPPGPAAGERAAQLGRLELVSVGAALHTDSKKIQHHRI